MDQYAIIVAAGTGTRMNSSLPKQFMDLQGKPIIAHTIERFKSYNPDLQIVLVLHKDFVQFWDELKRTIGFDIEHTVVEGGSERFHSVKKGLETIHSIDAIVGIHDAVRPLVSHQTLAACYLTASKTGSAIPVLPIHDTIRQVGDGASSTVDRSQFRIVQTPQCFDIGLLRTAYNQEFDPRFTDDASVVESLGHNLVLVEGNRSNIKITTQDDLILAKSLLNESL